MSKLRQFLLRLDTINSIEIVNDVDAYRLTVDRFTLDRVAFEEDAAAAIEGDYQAGVRALARWQGEPYVGFSWSPELKAQRTQLMALKRQVETAMRFGGNNPGKTPSKTTQPRVDIPTIIQRRRLLNRMPKVGESRVGLLTAPAGFGKSVALAQWAAAQTSPVAWVNLDQLDNDLDRFASALHDAIAATGVDVVSEVNRTDDTEGSPDILEGVLVDRDLVVGLVIDDLHQIVNPQVLEQVQRWVESPPTQFTLMIGSREPAPFRSARLEAQRRLSRITSRHLHFRPQETKAVLKRVQQADQAPEPSFDIHHQTEGWPLGVSYLARTERPQDVGDAITTLSEYIMEEVLSQIPTEIVSFLLATAHLDQLSPDLCDSVTGRNDAAEILAWLHEYQLFLVDDGAAPSQLRFHYLFSELLRHRAERDPTVDVPALQRRAARWCHGQSLPEDALKYALHGNDTEIILATAGDVLLRTALRGEHDACRTLLRALDPDTLGRDQRSHDIAMFIAIHSLDVADRAPWMESRLRYFGGTDDVLLDYVHSVECWYQGKADEALAHAERVIEAAPEYAKDHAPDLVPAFLDQAHATKLLARMLQGTLDHNDPLFKSLHGLAGPGGPLATARVIGMWSFIAYVDGADGLTAALVEVFERTKATVKEAYTACAVLGTITTTLIASDEGGPETPIVLTERLEKELDACLREGRYVEATLTHLALYRTYQEAGDRVAAVRHGRLADTFMRTFEDAPYLETARNRLIGGNVQTDSLATRRDVSPKSAELRQLLTEREQMVLNLLDSDLTLVEIANALFLSPNTIKYHTKSIYRKLKVHSRHQAVRRLLTD